MNIKVHYEDAEVINNLCKALDISSEEAVHLIIKFYQLRDPSDIQSIKWKLITKLQGNGINWHYLLTLRFLHITIGEILRQTNFHVRET